MVSILMPIHANWCDLILCGKKTVEMRKTRPKEDPPYRVYMYRTLPKRGDIHDGDGRIVGEFICDDIFRAVQTGYMGSGMCPTYNIGPNLAAACLTYDELENYGKGRPLFGWHILEAKAYDTPKELKEFHRPCTPACNFSNECGGSDTAECLFGVARPPQSWMYVEEKKW